MVESFATFAVDKWGETVNAHIFNLLNRLSTTICTNGGVPPRIMVKFMKYEAISSRVFLSEMEKYCIYFITNTVASENQLQSLCLYWNNLLIIIYFTYTYFRCVISVMYNLVVCRAKKRKAIINMNGHTWSVWKVSNLSSYLHAGVTISNPTHGILESSPHWIEQQASIGVSSSKSSPGTLIT